MPEHEFAVWAPRPARVRLDLDGALHPMTRSDDAWWRATVDAETHHVVFDSEQCIACQACVPACPYAAIFVAFVVAYLNALLFAVVHDGYARLTVRRPSLLGKPLCCRAVPSDVVLVGAPAARPGCPRAPPVHP